MTSSSATIARIGTILPEPQPESRGARLLLFAMRRMGANGLNDAQAQNALIGEFGQRYSRPLTALRTLMFELAQQSARPITIAPRCCCRMTADEAALVAIITRAVANPALAEMLLSDLTDRRRTPGLFMSVQFVADAFADAGQPLSM